MNYKAFYPLSGLLSHWEWCDFPVPIDLPSLPVSTGWRLLISANETSKVSVLWGGVLPLPEFPDLHFLAWESLPCLWCLEADSFLTQHLLRWRLLQGMEHSPISVCLCPRSASTAPFMFFHVAWLDNGGGVRDHTSMWVPARPQFALWAWCMPYPSTLCLFAAQTRLWLWSFHR